MNQAVKIYPKSWKGKAKADGDVVCGIYLTTSGYGPGKRYSISPWTSVVEALMHGGG